MLSFFFSILVLICCIYLVYDNHKAYAGVSALVVLFLCFNLGLDIGLIETVNDKSALFNTVAIVLRIVAYVILLVALLQAKAAKLR